MDDSPIQTALCLIGHPIGGNPAQFVVARALASLGLDWQFLSFDVQADRIDEAIAGIDALGFGGAIIAEPYQRTVASRLESRTQDTVIETATRPELREVVLERARSSTTEPWHDFLCRDQNGNMVPDNLRATALRQILDSHVESSGHGIQDCLLVGEPAKWGDMVTSCLPALPLARFVFDGTRIMSWVPLPPSNAAVPSDGADGGQSTLETETTPSPELPKPMLVIWLVRSAGSPSRRGVARSLGFNADVDFVTETLGGLHPASLCLDIGGSAAEWLSAIPIVNHCEWEVRRLAIAIERLTSRTPNLDAMREAIEEYLAI